MRGREYQGEDKDELIYILNVCIFSYPTHHCWRKSPKSAWNEIPPEKSLFNKPDGIGGAIGHLIWQNAVNYYFHEIDEWLLLLGFHYERFVDDMYFVTNNKTAFLAYTIPELRKRLEPLGAKLNEKKFYCQHYTKGVECLGTHIKTDRLYINNRIVRRAKAKARICNKRINENRIDKTLASINSYLGICKNLNGFRRACEIVGEIDKGWFKYIRFNKRRICLEPLPMYKERNRIINKYNLK